MLKIATERRLASLFGFIVSLGVLIITVIEQLQLERSLREAAAAGVIIDVSTDQPQMNLQMALALGLGSLCLWSRRMNLAAIVGGALFWGMCFLLSLAPNPFDRPEPLIHVAAVSALIIAIVCVRRQWSAPLNSLLAGGFVLINYVLWAAWTQRIKQNAEVGQLYPNTTLNNLIYGARGWHVA